MLSSNKKSVAKGDDKNMGPVGCLWKFFEL